MARTGYIITVYQDINPSSPTFNTVREERTLDSENCPTSAPSNWIEYTRYCEMYEGGMYSGYEIIIYMDVEPLSPTYNETREERVLNTTDCMVDGTSPNWQNIGEPFCKQMIYMPGGLLGNDGYMVQQQQDMNEYSETADQIRDIETLDLEHCPLPNTEPVWDIISESCHIVLFDGDLMYDGTKDVVRVNTNQYSATWNNNISETVNIEDRINCPSSIVPFPSQYFTFEALEDGTFTFTGRNNNSLSYSIDGGQTWIPLASGVASPTVTTGNRIFWKGITTPDPSLEGQYGIGQFSSTGRFKVFGNIMSIVVGDNFENTTTINDYQFGYLLRNTKAVNAHNLVLPSMTLTEKCYRGMFAGCSNLVTVPELPATTLAEECYGFMFSGCSSLTTPPVLPATTLADWCYNGMLQHCSSLTTAPQLPAMVMAEDCYAYMFNDCTSLTTPPVLSSRILANGCYQGMFSECTSLVASPTLPATTLADFCYDGMFSSTNVLPDCSNIDFTSTTVVHSGGLKGLFFGTNVTDADLQRILPKDRNNRYCLPVTALSSGCYTDMFAHCTSLETAPVLPATTMTNGCYLRMFLYCTNLLNAPELPATSLVYICYRQMFQGCSNLAAIKCLATDISAIDCTLDWVNGVAANGTFTKDSSMTDWTTGDSGIPSGWTVTDA